MSRIVAPLILILQLTDSETTIELENKREGSGGKINNEVNGDDDKNPGGLVETRKNTSSGKNFFTSKAKLALTRLREAFTNASILHDFLPEQYIGIKTDASAYVINGILSQFTSDQRFPKLV